MEQTILIQMSREDLNALIRDNVQAATADLLSELKKNAPRHDESKPWFTKTEVREMLNISASKLDRDIQRGLLRVRKIGRAYRINAEDLDAYINNSETEAVSNQKLQKLKYLKI